MGESLIPEWVAADIIEDLNRPSPLAELFPSREPIKYSRRQRLHFWMMACRERLALRIAPWLERD